MAGAAHQYPKALLALAMVVVLVVRALLVRRARRRAAGVDALARIEKRTTGALVVIALVAVCNYFGFSLRPLVSDTAFDGYDLVHYYLNAKYFDELGYVALYDAMVAADEQGERRYRKWRIREVRDLDSSQRVSIAKIRARAARTRARFSPRRWEQFKHDFEFLRQGLSSRLQLQLFYDHGYNGTPLLQTIGGPLTNAVRVEHVKWLCHIETLLIVLLFAVMARMRGVRVTAIAVGWYAVTFSARWPGISFGLLRIDWFVALVLACLLLTDADADGSPSRRRDAKLVGAGLLLAYSTMMKLFPAVWLFGLAARAAWRFGTTRTVDRVAAVVFAGFVAGSAALGTFAYASVGERNVAEFAEDIREHLHPLNLSPQRMGFGVALAYRGEIHRWDHEGARRERFLRVGELSPLRYAGALLALLLLAFTLRPPDAKNVAARTSAADATQLGFIPFYFLMIASHYYWIHRLTMVLHHAPRTDEDAEHLGALAGLFCIEAMANALDTWTGFRYGTVGTQSVALGAYCAWVIGARMWRVQRIPGRPSWLARAFRLRALPRPAVPAVLLFDGRCGLCSGVVRFVLRRDRRDAFVFAALESPAVTEVLAAHGGLAALPDSVVVVTDRGTPAERLLLRSDAIFFIADQLGHPWRLVLFGALFPRFVRDFVYDRVAASRARLFGRTEVCMVPTPEQRGRFLD